MATTGPLRGTLRRWRAKAVVNTYRGLVLFLIGATPILLRLCIVRPAIGAAVLGGALGLWYRRTEARKIAGLLPIPAHVRTAIAKDWAWFLGLTAKGPIYRCLVWAVKNVVDCDVVPSPVTALKATKVRSNSVSLSWEPQRASFLSDEAYRVEICVDGGEWTVAGDGGATATATTADLRDLPPGTLVAWRVTAHNHKGTAKAVGSSFVTRQKPNEGQGGTAPAYTWTQSVTETVIKVRVPPSTRSAALDVCIAPRRLRVALKDAETPLCAGSLWAEVDADESSWQFADGGADDHRVVEVTLTKRDANIGTPLWSAVIARDEGGDVDALRHPRVDLSLLPEKVPELTDHHLRELHELMQGGAAGGMLRDEDM